jgi:hypothetical protein
MSRRPWHDAMLIHHAGITLVVPKRGDLFYWRAADGAIGYRRDGLMFWCAVVETDFETIASERVSAEILELDVAIRDLARLVQSFRQ